MKRSNPKFMQIRPYGNIGDRKCDGLYFAEEPSTVFQVYSPDTLTLKEVQDKIDEDLTGAYEHWKETLKTWIFVYNVRRGLAPDVPKTLYEKKSIYPTIALDHLSNDGLWEIARSLTLQQRCEIFGAPNGYEHLFLFAQLAPEEVKKHLDTDSFVLVQDLLSPISIQAVSEALNPAKPFGAPFFIRPTYNTLPWTEAAIQQQQMVKEIIAKGRDLIPRYSVFSLAPIPLVIHLGFLLSDRVEVNYFQFDRDTSSWKWPKSDKIDLNIQVIGLPLETTEEPLEVAISVSLSAKIPKSDVKEGAPSANVFIDVFVEEPDIMWLRSLKQLAKLQQVIRDVLSLIRTKVPSCSQIHLFYAGPTGGAIVIGQQINPRMNPPVDLYEYSRQSTPRYQKALTLTGELS